MTSSSVRALCVRLNPGGQSKPARMIGVSPRTMRRWLSGKYEIPPMVELEIIAALLSRSSLRFKESCLIPTIPRPETLRLRFSLPFGPRKGKIVHPFIPFRKGLDQTAGVEYHKKLSEFLGST